MVSFLFLFIEVSQDEMYVDDSALAEDDGVEELVEISCGKRKPKYIPGVSKPLFHSTIRGSSNERKLSALDMNSVTKLVNDYLMISRL